MSDRRRTDDDGCLAALALSLDGEPGEISLRIACVHQESSSRPRKLEPAIATRERLRRRAFSVDLRHTDDRAGDRRSVAATRTYHPAKRSRLRWGLINPQITLDFLPGARVEIFRYGPRTASK